jgi:hypothetical protein
MRIFSREKTTPWIRPEKPAGEPGVRTAEDVAIIKPYAARMDYELRTNMHKGGRTTWLDIEPKELMAEVYLHAGKLQSALMAGDGAKVLEYAADVGNLCAMVADRCGLLGLPTLEQIAADAEERLKERKVVDWDS